MAGNAPNLPAHLAYCACDPCVRTIDSDATPLLCSPCKAGGCTEEGDTCKAIPVSVTNDVIEMLPVPNEGADCEWRRMTPEECEARGNCDEGARLELPGGASIELIAHEMGLGIVGWSVLYFRSESAPEECWNEDEPDAIACLPSIAGGLRDWEEMQSRA